MAPKKKLNFEESTARLEEIVSLLERGDAPLLVATLSSKVCVKCLACYKRDTSAC